MIDLLGFWNVPINQICDGSLNQSYSINCNDTESIIKELQDKYSQVFETGLGCCTKSKAQLHLHAEAKPIFKAKRPVPYAAIETLDKELNRLVDLKVISPLTYSEWAAPIVVIRKFDGSLRICADFSTIASTSIAPT